MIERKIVEVGDAIRDKLRAPSPLSVGDIVLTQMKANFNDMEKDDHYRVLTSMPPDSTVEFLKNTFKITDHHAKRAKCFKKSKVFFQLQIPSQAGGFLRIHLLKLNSFMKVMKLVGRCQEKKTQSVC